MNTEWRLTIRSLAWGALISASGVLALWLPMQDWYRASGIQPYLLAALAAPSLPGLVIGMALPDGSAHGGPGPMGFLLAPVINWIVWSLVIWSFLRKRRH